MTTLQQVQAFSWLLALIGLAACVAWYRSKPKQIGYITAPGTILLHAFVLYTAVFLRDYAGLLAGMNFTFWSALLRMQTLVMIAGVCVVMAMQLFVITRNWKQHAS